MNTVKYDFSQFKDILFTMKSRDYPGSSDLAALKKELNKFFKDSECKEVLYTNNTDKMFFGAKVIAMIDADDIYEYLVEEEPERISKYIIELDSHLFDPILDLSEEELLAIIIHEVGHIVGDTEPMENARNALNAYLASNKTHIKISQSIHYKEILAYGLKDYLSKTRSMFYTSNASEIYADEFARAYGLGEALGSAYDKITKNNIKLYENSEISKFITFGWTLSIYANMKIRRVGAIRTLMRAKQLTGSKLEIMEMDNVIRRIKRIDDDMILESTGSNDSLRLKIKAKMKKARINNLRTIDGTFFELNMQIRNVEDENDALYLMRQINNSIAIIEEYRSNEDLDEFERKKWDDALKRFIQLRENLSSTVTYKNNYAMIIQYPDIVENRY